MKPVRIIFILSVAITVAATGIALRRVLLTRRLQASLARTLEDEASLRSLAGQLVTARGRRAPGNKAPSSSRPAGRLPMTAQTDSEDAPARQLQRILRAMADIDLHDRPFFTKLGLTPGQMKGVERLVAEYSERLNDINAAAGTEGLETSDPEIVRMRRSEVAQYENQMNALIGPGDLVQFQEFTRVQPAELLVADLAATAFHAGAPISAVQEAALTQIIAQASPDYRKGGRVNTDTVDWDAVRKQAEQAIPPAQFQALQNAGADTVNRSELRRLTIALSARSP